MKTNRLVTFAFALCLACGSSGESSGPGGTATDLSIVLGASTAAYPHQDAFASQTAKAVSAGIRKLELLDDQGGSWVVFDAGSSAADVTVQWNHGARTTIATVDPSAVRAGHYVSARLTQDWSRFEIDATLHEGGTATAGKLSVFQVTSDGTTVDGKSYDSGDYEHTFSSAQGSKAFDGFAIIPSQSATAEAQAVLENGDWVVTFACDVTVPAAAKGTLSVIANMDRAFRWSETPGSGYTDGVYDIAPPLYEVVEQFGANRFDVALKP